MKRLFGLFGTSTNAATDNNAQVPVKAKVKLVQLQLNDQHEPFGTISIDRIKAALEEEDFAELQSLYHLMKRDVTITSKLQARRMPLLQCRYVIESDNTAFVEWAQNSAQIKKLINMLSHGIYSGVALIDVQYQVIDAKLVPNLKQISPRFLHAHTDKHLKTTAEHLYIKQGMDKRFISQLPADKHVFHKHSVDEGEITDFSLASKLVWYFSLKHIALAHNLQYFDAVATPPLIAKTEGSEDDLITALYALKSASVGVFGKDDTLEYLNVTSKAEFLAFIQYLDKEITSLILGNTLSTGEGRTGSYSQSKTHEKRQREVLAFDASIIEDTITDYLNRLEQLNFANAKGVTFAFDVKEKQDLSELSQVVKNLSDSGFELDAKDIEAQFGIKITGKKQAPGTQTKQDNTIDANTDANTLPCGCPALATSHNHIVVAANAAADAKKLPTKQDTLDTKEDDTTALETTLLANVEAVFAEATSFEDAYNKLLDAYPNFAIDDLEAALFKAVANADLLGDAEVD